MPVRAPITQFTSWNLRYARSPRMFRPAIRMRKVVPNRNQVSGVFAHSAMPMMASLPLAAP
jgi:hypothetical protein